MNARQKAKKLKQELDFYKRMIFPVKCEETTHKVETCCYKAVFYKDNPYESNFILKKAIKSAKLSIPDDMVTIDICDYLNFPNTSMLTATVQVINPKVEEEA